MGKRCTRVRTTSLTSRSPATATTPVNTSWTAPARRLSMRTASAGLAGLARISPSITTVVSAARITLPDFRHRSATARAFARATRSTYACGSSPGSSDSSTSAASIENSNPALVSSSARRGEADARISGGLDDGMTDANLTHAMLGNRPAFRSARLFDVDQVRLDHQQVLLARLPDHREQPVHLHDFLELLVDEPLKEALREVVVLLHGDLHQRGDLAGHFLFPGERRLHRGVGRRERRCGGGNR